VWQERVKEIEAQLEESEKARKELNGGGNRRSGLREEEERYLREEKLRDQLEEMRRVKKEMEARVLERDSKAMELRFDLEDREREVDRLRRRNKELETYRVALSKEGGDGKATAAGNGGGGNGNGEADGDRKAGGRFKRERDLEGVVEALKRVVEKLRGENERLRRGAAEHSKVAESERRAKELKSKMAEMQEELISLRTRVAAGDDAATRLAQKQDLLQQLRKQLKGRDEVVQSWRTKYESLEKEKEVVSKELDRANLRIIALEKEMIGLRKLGSSTSRDDRELERLRGQIAEQKGVIESMRTASGESGAFAR